MIDRKAAELRGRGITDKEASSIINAELEYDMKQLVHQVSEKSVNRESLLKIGDRHCDYGGEVFTGGIPALWTGLPGIYFLWDVPSSFGYIGAFECGTEAFQQSGDGNGRKPQG